MTFAVLRALHTILADALDDIERIYSPAKLSPEHSPSTEDNKASYASPPPSPSLPLDFPSLDAPYDPNDPAEQLTTHPEVVQAINKIVAAAGQMATAVQAPFYSLCDASMGYHLPSCMRLLEASHTVEILREAGPNGLHVDLISQRNGVDSGKLAHILRLLATHHFIREKSPNVFTINRISSLMDTGKSFEEIKQWEREGRLEVKYQNTNGIAAFVGMCSDELFKSSAYLTEAYLQRTHPSRPPFGYAFDTDVGFFPWLEGEGGDGKLGIVNKDKLRVERFGKAMSGTGSWEAPGAVFDGFDWHNLPRGSIIVDVGGGIGSTSMLLANAFCRSGGRGKSSPVSPSFSGSPGRKREEDLGFKFIIQDRPVVVEMGEKAWRAKCPELLDSGIAQFQVHDFFTMQPIRNAAVFFLRVILHDWPNALARTILLRLREAATPETKLVLAEFVLPLACVDVDVTNDHLGPGVLDEVEGAESTLAPAPLLANLGKASANAYWMDLTMQVTFNAQERTLRETTALALSAGWKVVKVTRAPGSLFGHIVAVPVAMPLQCRARSGSASAFLDVPPTANGIQTGDISGGRSKQEITDMERSRSRCGTPTFGSKTDLPSMQEAMARFGGGITRSRAPGPMARYRSVPVQPGISKLPTANTSLMGFHPPPVKKKPSPLALSSPKPSSPSPTSPFLSSPQSSMKRRVSLAHLHSPSQQQGFGPPLILPRDRQMPPSPMSPRHPHFAQHPLSQPESNAQLKHTPTRSLTAVIPTPSSLPPSQPTLASPPPRPRSLSRPKSLAHLYQTAHSQSTSPMRKSRSPIPPLPPSILRPGLSSSTSLSSHNPAPAPPPRLGPIPRRASYAPAPQASSLRKRSGTVIGPPVGAAGIGGAVSMTNLLKADTVRGSGGGSLNFGKTSTKEGQRPEPAAQGKVSLLAAAARIERGVVSRPTSP
ncbi:Sterigmatocystin 8-O-methyltransferase [Termitomyces sp. T112]|nr:Sterigmatocystin 8-O-methyltransferase [Termitomyces sp. T112]